MNENYISGNGMDVGGGLRVTTIRCGIPALKELTVQLRIQTSKTNAPISQHTFRTVMVVKGKRSTVVLDVKRGILVDWEAPEGFPKTETAEPRSES